MSEKKYNQKEEFYVSLPSDGDTQKTFPNNDPGSYKIPLAVPLDLSEGQWHVAMTDMFIPNYFYNITEKLRVVNFARLRGPLTPDTDPEYKTWRAPEGYYTARTWVLAVNSFLLRNFEAFQGRFSYNQNSKVISVGLYYGEVVHIPSPDLCKMLGVDKGGEAGSTPWSPDTDPVVKAYLELHHRRTMNVVLSHLDARRYMKMKKIWFQNPSFFTMFSQYLFVYTNIIEYSHVGASMLPILRIVNIIGKEDETAKDSLFRSYDVPHYHKVKASVIQEIEIHLADNTGTKLNITAGETLVTLHFKKIFQKDGESREQISFGQD